VCQPPCVKQCRSRCMLHAMGKGRLLAGGSEAHGQAAKQDTNAVTQVGQELCSTASRQAETELSTSKHQTWHTAVQLTDLRCLCVQPQVTLSQSTGEKVHNCGTFTACRCLPSTVIARTRVCQPPSTSVSRSVSQSAKTHHDQHAPRHPTCCVHTHPWVRTPCLAVPCPLSACKHAKVSTPGRCCLQLDSTARPAAAHSVNQSVTSQSLVSQSVNQSISQSVSHALPCSSV
jgi:hypothetical protein